MRIRQLLLLAIIIIPLFSRAQNLITGKWKIKSSYVILNTDTTYLFKVNQSKNMYELSKISYSFGQSDSYLGTSVDGTAINGIWHQQAGQIAIDSIVSSFQLINPYEFTISSPFNLSDTLGNTVSALSILHFYDSVGIAKLKFNVSVSPNPFSKSIEVTIQSPNQFIASIELKSAIGQLVYIEPARTFDVYNKFTITTNDLPAGTYFFSLKSDVIKENRKIVKTN